jgi:hypothetical protein
MQKRKVTIYINDKTWIEFLKKVLEKRGKAAGGAISEEVENAIKKWLRE